MFRGGLVGLGTSPTVHPWSDELCPSPIAGSAKGSLSETPPIRTLVDLTGG